MGLLVKGGVKPAAAAVLARDIRATGVAHLGMFTIGYRTGEVVA